MTNEVSFMANEVSFEVNGTPFLTRKASKTGLET